MDMAVTDKKPAASAWAPFSHSSFAVLWVATVVSNIGTWMHDVGAGWLMTELSSSPLVVSAVQAATTLPVFLFALLAGAVADIVDRRKLLIAVNVLLAAAAATLATLVSLDLVTPLVLILFTFALGTGAAFVAPAWQAIVPSLVPRSELPAAIALNSMGINVSRAIGPAVAGVLIVGVGLWSPFALNAVSFIGIIAALLWWKPPVTAEKTLPPEDVGAAIVAGLRYAVHSSPLRATLVRALAFFLFASAFWSMLPLIARVVLSGGPTLYGLLLTSVGVGAVAGALLLPRLRTRFGLNRIVALGSVGVATSLMLLALVPVAGVALVAAVIAGLSWISVLSSLNHAAQMALPDWVRARGLSIFLTVFFGAMSLGSLVWGQIANSYGIPVAMLLAALGAIVMIPVTWRSQINDTEGNGLAPSMHWPAPILSGDNAEPDKPVMIQVMYAVGATDRDRFLALMRELSDARRRSGGYDWSVMQDAADPRRFVETWREASWTQHLRHHDRVSLQDQDIQARIRRLQIDDAQPSVTHLVTPSH